MKDPATTVQARPAWWVRLAATLPWWLLNAVGDFLAWLALRIRYGQKVMRPSLELAFPEFDEARLNAVMRDYYRGFGQILVEIVKSAGISAEELRRRVVLKDFEQVREQMRAGSPVLLVAVHQFNWEWMLLGLSLELGFPLQAAYKPLVDGWAQREMLKVRSRFGAQLVPAQELLGQIIRGGRTPRAIAMVADQEPRDSEKRYWTRFLNRDTAFFMGTEEIARTTRYPVFFVGLRRTARGCYEVSATPLATKGEQLPPGELTERYARRAEAAIRSSPSDWPWSHKRWKLKKPVYGG